MKGPVITAIEAGKHYARFEQIPGFISLNGKICYRIHSESYGDPDSADIWADMILMAAEAITNDKQ